MAGIPSEHARDVREALHSVAFDPELGPATLSDAAAMSNLLKDLLPDAPREKNLLVAAAESRLAAIMLDHVGQGIDARSAIRLAAASFGTNTLYSDEVCQWVASELAIALDLAPGLADGRTELPAEDAEAPVASAAEAGTAHVPAATTAAAPVPAEPAPVLAAAATPAAAQLAPVPSLTTNDPTDLPAADGQAMRDRAADGPDAVGDGPSSGWLARRLGLSGLLVLAGLAVAVTGYLIPVIDDRYYYHDVKVLDLTSHLGYSGLIGLVAAVVFAAATTLAPRGTRWLVAAGAGAAGSGLLVGYTFWHIYSTYVRSGYDNARPGIVIGPIGAALLIAGGVAALFRFRAGSQPKVSRSLSREPR
jgi:hypothetical protein